MRMPVPAVRALCIATALSPYAGATQVVHLDFDSRTGGADHVYSASERAEILERVEQDYAGFDFDFSLTSPTAGPYSTIYLNDGPELGLASEIDFRNLNLSSTATVNLGTSPLPRDVWVTLTANVVSHELGHLVGLRHFDSIGPIGSGIDPNTAPPSAFLPTYPGPTGATETRFHVMESDSFGIESTFDQHFGARSLVRLTFNEQGVTVNEGPGARGDIASAQPIPLAALDVPNTIPAGHTFHGDLFDVDAVSVVGSLDQPSESDFYRFTADAGDLFNFHVMGGTLDRHTNPADTMVEVLDSSGTVLGYYGELAQNDDEYESLDSVLIDLQIPDTGDYFVRVTGYAGDTGQYELYGYRFAALAVPEPGAIGALLVGLATLLTVRRPDRATC